jgi:hypothetical protein
MLLAGGPIEPLWLRALLIILIIISIVMVMMFNVYNVHTVLCILHVAFRISCSLYNGYMMEISCVFGQVSVDFGPSYG